LRGGPYFALGRALAYHKQHEQAALAFMRVPTLYPKDSQLVIEALLAAAVELEKLGRTEEASSLYRELVNDYQETPQAAQAAVRLKAISGNATDE
jgi:TolA-binding protein